MTSISRAGISTTAGCSCSTSSISKRSHVSTTWNTTWNRAPAPAPARLPLRLPRASSRPGRNPLVVAMLATGGRGLVTDLVEDATAGPSASDDGGLRLGRGKVLFLLDRDGVINVDRGTWVTDPDDLELEAGSADAICSLNDAGHKVVIVTNQSCVGRGLITEGDLSGIHHRLKQLLSEQGAHIDGIFHAPDAPGAGAEGVPETSPFWRKPGPGMMMAAMAIHGAEPHQAVMIGDTASDMLASKRAGCSRSVLVTTGHGVKVGEALAAQGVDLPARITNDCGLDVGIPEEALPVVVHR
eukprot:CAMPEP_0182869042 /NCGR_PEP_ID=MMETSP0034_2-20130328/9688_1 /TAXON_ID=156128 /ORGANISM="Nephroselmis pyriformis, Strain CCMP717" /LENGTH=297 /DNA_ID=CAMNT_0025001479 /DNA_START=132 /DNA_END=1022 /DNA_ORIENTATION=-